MQVREDHKNRDGPGVDLLVGLPVVPIANHTFGELLDEVVRTKAKTEGLNVNFKTVYLLPDARAINLNLAPAYDDPNLDICATRSWVHDNFQHQTFTTLRYFVDVEGSGPAPSRATDTFGACSLPCITRLTQWIGNLSKFVGNLFLPKSPKVHFLD